MEPIILYQYERRNTSAYVMEKCKDIFPSMWEWDISDNGWDESVIDDELLQEDVSALSDRFSVMALYNKLLSKGEIQEFFDPTPFQYFGERYAFPTIVANYGSPAHEDIDEYQSRLKIRYICSHLTWIKARKRAITLERVLYARNAAVNLNLPTKIEEKPNEYVSQLRVENVTQEWPELDDVIGMFKGEHFLYKFMCSVGAEFMFGMMRRELKMKSSDLPSDFDPDVQMTLQIFRKAIEGMRKMPPLCLAACQKMSSGGISILIRMRDFLLECMKSDIDTSIRIITAELMLHLAFLRGSLADILMWVEAATDCPKDVSMETEIFVAFVQQVQKSSPFYTENLAHRTMKILTMECFTDSHYPIYNFAQKLLQVITCECHVYMLYLKERMGMDLKSINHDEDCKLWVWGSNACEELGVSRLDRKDSPLLSTAITNIERADGGVLCTFYVTKEGELYALGKSDCSNDGGCSLFVEVSRRDKVSFVSASKGGDGHVLIVTEDGSLCSLGDNDHGQLGLGRNTRVEKPARIKSFSKAKVVCVSAGYKHSAAVTESGKLYTWGCGTFGKLGHGDVVSRNTPTLVSNLDSVQGVSCGATHTLALSTCGNVWSFGCGTGGALGHSDEDNATLPKMIQFFKDKKIRKVCAGDKISMALDKSGLVFAWGSGFCLGIPGVNMLKIPTQILDLCNIEDICVGSMHCLALCREGKVYAWGRNGNAECGQGCSGEEVQVPTLVAVEGPVFQIAAGSNHSLAWNTIPKGRLNALSSRPFCFDTSSETFSALFAILKADTERSPEENERRFAFVDDDVLLSPHNATLLNVLTLLLNHLMFQNMLPVRGYLKQKSAFRDLLVGMLERKEYEEVWHMVELCLQVGCQYFLRSTCYALRLMVDTLSELDIFCVPSTSDHSFTILPRGQEKIIQLTAKYLLTCKNLDTIFYDSGKKLVPYYCDDDEMKNVPHRHYRMLYDCMFQMLIVLKEYTLHCLREFAFKMEAYGETNVEEMEVVEGELEIFEVVNNLFFSLQTHNLMKCIWMGKDAIYDSSDIRCIYRDILIDISGYMFDACQTVYEAAVSILRQFPQTWKTVTAFIFNSFAGSALSIRLHFLVNGTIDRFIVPPRKLLTAADNYLKILPYNFDPISREISEMRLDGMPHLYPWECAWLIDLTNALALFTGRVVVSNTRVYTPTFKYLKQINGTLKKLIAITIKEKLNVLDEFEEILSVVKLFCKKMARTQYEGEELDATKISMLMKLSTLVDGETLRAINNSFVPPGGKCRGVFDDLFARLEKFMKTKWNDSHSTADTRHRLLIRTAVRIASLAYFQLILSHDGENTGKWVPKRGCSLQVFNMGCKLFGKLREMERSKEMEGRAASYCAVLGNVVYNGIFLLVCMEEYRKKRSSYASSVTTTYSKIENKVLADVLTAFVLNPFNCNDEYSTNFFIKWASECFNRRRICECSCEELFVCGVEEGNAEEKISRWIKCSLLSGFVLEREREKFGNSKRKFAGDSFQCCRLRSTGEKDDILREFWELDIDLDVKIGELTRCHVEYLSEHLGECGDGGGNDSMSRLRMLQIMILPVPNANNILKCVDTKWINLYLTECWYALANHDNSAACDGFIVEYLTCAVNAYFLILREYFVSHRHEMTKLLSQAWADSIHELFLHAQRMFDKRVLILNVIHGLNLGQSSGFENSSNAAEATTAAPACSFKERTLDVCLQIRAIESHMAHIFQFALMLSFNSEFIRCNNERMDRYFTKEWVELLIKCFARIDKVPFVDSDYVKLLAVKLLGEILPKAVAYSKDNYWCKQVCTYLFDLLYGCVWIYPGICEEIELRLKEKNLCERLLWFKKSDYNFEYGEAAPNAVCCDLYFDEEKSFGCDIPALNIAEHGGGDSKGFAITNRPLRKNFQKGRKSYWEWRLQILDQEEDDCVSIGITTQPMTEESNFSDAWCYQSTNGKLFHNGEMDVCLPKYGKGDYVTVSLDLDAGILKFAKNYGPFIVAFKRLDMQLAYYPCVAFDKKNARQKCARPIVVQLCASFANGNTVEYLRGEPFLAPLPFAFAEEFIEVIRKLRFHLTKITRERNDIVVECMQDRVKEASVIFERVELRRQRGGYDHANIPASLITTAVEIDNAANGPNMLEIEDLHLDTLCRTVWPILAVMSRVDTGVRHGTRVTPQEFSRGVSKNQPWMLETYYMEKKISGLEMGFFALKSIEGVEDFIDEIGYAFDFSNFPLDETFLKMLTILSGVTGQIRYPVFLSTTEEKERLEKKAWVCANPAMNSVTAFSNEFVSSVLGYLRVGVDGNDTSNNMKDMQVAQKAYLRIMEFEDKCFKFFHLRHICLKTLANIFNTQNCVRSMLKIHLEESDGNDEELSRMLRDIFRCMFDVRKDEKRVPEYRSSLEADRSLNLLSQAHQRHLREYLWYAETTPDLDVLPIENPTTRSKRTWSSTNLMDGIISNDSRRRRIGNEHPWLEDEEQEVRTLSMEFYQINARASNSSAEYARNYAECVCESGTDAEMTSVSSRLSSVTSMLLVLKFSSEHIENILDNTDSTKMHYFVYYFTYGLTHPCGYPPTECACSTYIQEAQFQGVSFATLLSDILSNLYTTDNFFRDRLWNVLGVSNANVDDREADVDDREANVDDREANVGDREANVGDREANVGDRDEHCEVYDSKFTSNEKPVVEEGRPLFENLQNITPPPLLVRTFTRYQEHVFEAQYKESVCYVCFDHASSHAYKQRHSGCGVLLSNKWSCGEFDSHGERLNFCLNCSAIRKRKILNKRRDVDDCFLVMPPKDEVSEHYGIQNKTLMQMVASMIREVEWNPLLMKARNERVELETIYLNRPVYHNSTFDSRECTANKNRWQKMEMMLECPCPITRLRHALDIHAFVFRSQINRALAGVVKFLFQEEQDREIDLKLALRICGMDKVNDIMDIMRLVLIEIPSNNRNDRQFVSFRVLEELCHLLNNCADTGYTDASTLLCADILRHSTSHDSKDGFRFVQYLLSDFKCLLATTGESAHELFDSLAACAISPNLKMETKKWALEVLADLLSEKNLLEMPKVKFAPISTPISKWDVTPEIPFRYRRLDVVWAWDGRNSCLATWINDFTLKLYKMECDSSSADKCKGWELQGIIRLPSCEGFNGKSAGMKFSPCGMFLAVAGGRQVYFLNVQKYLATKNETDCGFTKKFEDEVVRVNWMRGNNGTDVVLIGFMDGSLFLCFEAPFFNDKEEAHYLQIGHCNDVVSKFIPERDGSFLVLWQKGLLLQWGCEGSSPKMVEIGEDFKMVHRHAGGAFLATVEASRGNICGIWAEVASKWKVIRYLEPENSTINVMCWSSGWKDPVLCVASSDRIATYRFKFKDGALTYDYENFKDDTGEVTAMASNESGNILVVGTDRDRVNVWCLRRKHLMQSIVGPGVVRQVKWLEHGTFAAFFANQHYGKLLTFNYHEVYDYMPDLLKMLTEKFLGSIGLKSAYKAPSLWTLFRYLPTIMGLQYEYERRCVASGQTLVVSNYLRSLIGLGMIAGLEDALPQTHWLKLFICATETVESVNKRLSIPQELLKMRFSNVAGSDMENLQIAAKNYNWEPSTDEEIMLWYSDHMEQWIPKERVVYGWGSIRNGELGLAQNAVPGSMAVEKPILLPDFSKASQIVCGNQCTFMIDGNGILYSCGNGGNGRTGHGHSENIADPYPVTALMSHYVVEVAASIFGPGHAIAITNFGEAYSWGNSDHGKLGLGDVQDGTRHPHIIKDLRFEHALHASCGANHSAIVTLSGKLYTFGNCKNGRLGRTNQTNIPTPILENHKWVQVSCGMDDTVALTDDGKVFKFGKQRCPSDSVSRILDKWSEVPIRKIVAGLDFTLFLMENGSIYSWDLFHPSHLSIVCDGSECLYARPLLNIPANIVDVCVGSSAILALGEDGSVYEWSTPICPEIKEAHIRPVLISEKRQIRQISAGHKHKVMLEAEGPCPLSVGPFRSVVFDVPTAIPAYYDRLAKMNVPVQAVAYRLQIFHYLSELVAHCYHLLPLGSPENVPYNQKFQGIRSVMMERVYKSLFASVLQKTTIKRADNVIMNVKRFEDPLTGNKKPIFVQMAKQVIAQSRYDPRSLWASDRVWKINLEGEYAEDAGGVLHEIMSDMCDELEMANVLDVLMKTPNNVAQYGENIDKYIINPSCTSSKNLSFFGILLGVTARMNKPINLKLSDMMWKLLVGDMVDFDDVRKNDAYFYQVISSIATGEGMNAENFNLIIPYERFECPGWDGKTTVLNNVPLTFENRLVYAKACLKARLDAFDYSIVFIREGLSTVIPVPLLDLSSRGFLEKHICGLSVFDVTALKRITKYKYDNEECNQTIRWFWEVIESYSDVEKSLFLRFVSGRSRMTKIIEEMHDFWICMVSTAVDVYPTASTCFFQLRLPMYTSRESLRSCLTFAIYHCRSIDADRAVVH